MVRVRAAVWMLLATAVATGVMLLSGRGREESVQARIVHVTRGSVRCIAALTGRVTYTGQHAACASLPGQVAEIYVAPGQRVAAGQALLRLDASAAERAAQSLAAEAVAPAMSVQTLLEGAIIRAPENATVRQVLAQEHGYLAAGEPAVVLSANEQAVLCAATEREGRQICPGMRAVLMVDGAAVGEADVVSVGPVEADAATGRLLCPVTLSPRQRLALPQGASLEADVVITERVNVPVLPVEAVTERGTLWWVHDGICTEIPAEIVLSDEMYVWVVLPEGTAVAVGEFMDGQRVAQGAQ